MNLANLAIAVLEAADNAGVPFMAVGALAAGAYGVPRSTKDIDLLVSVDIGGGPGKLIEELKPIVQFESQIAFDSLTWGRRHVGTSHSSPPFKVELFELFDDPFVREEFSRKQQVFVPMLNRSTWLPTAEDVVVQKLRWGRPKDLEDAFDVIAVQGFETLDMNYIGKWCCLHGTSERLGKITSRLLG